jgi:hypothetical protein
LLLLADSALSRNQLPRALRYATQLTTVLSKRAKPEGISAADWEKKKKAGLGRGYWIAGVVQSGQNNYAASNQSLRAALPLIEGDANMLPIALFHLGVVNYQLGRMTANKAQVIEAAKFSERAAAMNSPVAMDAARNANVMRIEAHKMP